MGASHPGWVRSQNQDRYLIRPIPGGVVAAVADGIGGSQGGQEASGLAIAAFDQALGDSVGEIAQLVGAVAEANRRVFKQGHEVPKLAGMGTTLTVGVVVANRLFLAHVGDSRAYLVTEQGLEQLTQDHSLVAEMEREGALSPEEAETHPQRNVLTRAIGPYDHVRIDVVERKWKAKDRLLLCSDGLFKTVSEIRLSDILHRLSGQPAVDALLGAALEEGGIDNVTVVLVESDRPKGGRS